MGAVCLTTLVLALSVFVSEQDQTLRAESDPIDGAAATLDQSIQILNEALLSNQPQDRRKAAQTIGNLRSKIDESAWAIGGLLSDPRPAIRIAAIDALLKFDDPGLVRCYARALADREPRVQCRALIGIYHLICRHERLPPLAGVTEPADTSAWYEEAIRTAKRRSVRGLLALACEQKSEDVRFAIPIVAKSLGGGDHHLCGEMCSVLLGQSASRALGRCLSDTDASIRRGAARMLFELETYNSTARETLDAAEAITAGFSDSDPVVRLYCLLTLTKHKDADLNRFTELACDADPTVRCAAVAAMKNRRPKDAVNILCKVAVHDSSNRVRVRAAFALASLAASDATEKALIAKRITSEHAPRARTLLNMGITYYYCDEDNAKHAPHIQNAEPAIASVFKAIREERTHPLPDDVNPRNSDAFDSVLIAALGACGPVARQAVPQILQDLTGLTSLGSGDYRTSGEDGRLQNCLYALARIGPTPELIDALEHHHQVVRTMAAMALSEHEQYAPRAVPVLVDSLNRDCWGQCVYSHTLRTDVSCLARFGHKSVPALLTLLRTNTHVYMASEALSLMELDAERVIPLLLPVLSDNDEPLHVRVAIANALGSVGVKDSRVFQGLANVLLDDKEAEPVRVATAKSISGSQAGDTILLLRKVTDDRSKAVRKVAEEAIRRFESAHKDS
jgi:HEAT repeat protein